MNKEHFWQQTFSIAQYAFYIITTSQILPFICQNLVDAEQLSITKKSDYSWLCNRKHCLKRQDGLDNI